MTTREKAPTILTAAGARRQQAEHRLLVIRNALTMADEELERALVERDWEEFGLASFEEYCEVKLPAMKHIRLKAPARQARAKMLLKHGATERAIAAATGSSVGTAHNDVVYLTTGKKPGDVLKNEHRANTPRAAEQPVSPPPPQVSNVDRAVALVAAQGARGLTVRELCHEAGWHHGQASGALTKAHQRGMIVRSNSYRDRCAAYLRP